MNMTMKLKVLIYCSMKKYKKTIDEGSWELYVLFPFSLSIFIALLTQDLRIGGLVYFGWVTLLLVLHILSKLPD